MPTMSTMMLMKPNKAPKPLISEVVAVKYSMTAPMTIKTKPNILLIKEAQNESPSSLICCFDPCVPVFLVFL